MDGLNTFLSTKISEEDEQILSSIIDHSHTGYVSAFRFSEFLKGFGPIKKAISKMSRVVREPWFYHFLSQKEAKHLLYGEKPATFLVRFSKSRPGSFALEFVFRNRVQSVIIEGCMPEGLKVREQGELERVFEDIYGILEKYRKLLVYPFRTSLPIRSKTSWFHGDVTRQEAAEMLRGLKPGTYLVRFGEKPEEYFANYVRHTEEMGEMKLNYFPQEPEKKFLLSDADGDTGGGVSFPTLEDFVRSKRHIFKYNYDAEGVPSFRIKRVPNLTNTMPLLTIQGPADIMQGDSVRLENVAGSCMSAYPPNPGGWWPICDTYRIDIYQDVTALVICDGCNWGHRPQTAAHIARNAVCDYIKSHIDKIEDCKQAGHELQESFNYAHKKIIEPHDMITDAGTTTVLAGLLLKLDEDESIGRYGFVVASVGDCKAYLWSKRTGEVFGKFAQLTQQISPRATAVALTRPIPAVALARSWTVVRPTTATWPCTLFLQKKAMPSGPLRTVPALQLTLTGVFDNFDPETLGLAPCDLPFGRKETSFKEMNVLEAEDLKTRYTLEELRKICKDTKPTYLPKKLTDHAIKVNEASVQWMRTNPAGKLPSDYQKYPGKMDHTTCALFVVGEGSPAISRKGN